MVNLSTFIIIEHMDDPKFFYSKRETLFAVERRLRFPARKQLSTDKENSFCC